MPDADITIRECLTVEDFKQCIELERAVWRDEDIDIMPIRLYMISKACNAPTIGAFDQTGRLVGFVHTSLALIGKNVAFHSHMAAVLEDLRHKDIGYRIKLAQRERALESGIPLIIWTFDPLQSRNAHFNINKLGAIIRRYEVNYYGEGVSTVFDANVPTDRVFAEWWVCSPHVEATLAGNRPAMDADLTVTIPADIAAVSARSVEDHRRWRVRVREDFQAALATGKIVRGFARDEKMAESRYLLGPDEAQFQFVSYNEARTI
ncbi:MAG TPA: GNAT family N-acetyltransferase [Blastocatellia bacterium]|nr:GNAT family N-acetyltransferase [Blastocatellia bacterium]